MALLRYRRRDHAARDLAVPPLHPELPRCRGTAGRARARHLLRERAQLSAEIRGSAAVPSKTARIIEEPWAHVQPAAARRLSVATSKNQSTKKLLAACHRLMVGLPANAATPRIFVLYDQDQREGERQDQHKSMRLYLAIYLAVNYGSIV